jgi:hypothetical protein
VWFKLLITKDLSEKSGLLFSTNDAKKNAGNSPGDNYASIRIIRQRKQVQDD